MKRRFPRLGAPCRACARLPAFVLFLALAACSSSGGGDSGNNNAGSGGDGDCGIETAPYLTESPSISPTSGSVASPDLFSVSLTAEGAVDISDVVVWLYDFNYTPDNETGSLAAFGTLTQDTGTTTWSGDLTDNDGSYGTASQGEHYLWIWLTNGEDTYTQYWHDPDESETKYWCIQAIYTSETDFEYAYGLSELDIVSVTIGP
jgi:hypothetical protein